MTYAVVTDVEARLPGRPTFDGTSQPTVTAVGDWVDIAEGRIEAVLLAIQATVPVTNARGILVMKDLALYYAVGLTEAALASAGGDGSNVAGQEKLQYFEDTLKAWAADPSGTSAMLEGGSASDSTRRVRSHLTDHPDGQTVAAGDFAPTFNKRDGSDQF